MRRALLAAVVAVAMMAGGQTVASAGVVRGYPHSYRCQSVHLKGQGRFRVTVLKGHVKCSTARRVLRDFMNGKGKLHGPRNGPAYRQSWTLDGGWRCGHGAGGGACIRGGRNYRTASQFIEIEWVSR